jgi:hypothetical protein
MRSTEVQLRAVKHSTSTEVQQPRCDHARSLVEIEGCAVGLCACLKDQGCAYLHQQQQQLIENHAQVHAGNIHWCTLQHQAQQTGMQRAAYTPPFHMIAWFRHACPVPGA